MSDDGVASDHSLLIRLLESVAELRGEVRAYNDRTSGLEADVTLVKAQVRVLELQAESLVSLEDLTAADVARERKVSDALEVADRKATQARAAADRRANYRLGILMAAVAIINVGIAFLR